VNGYFTTNLVRHGTYTYDPENYHGPSLYYFALVSEVLFGLTSEAMRLVPALFGIGLVALVLALRPYLGSVAVLAAAALLAVSPGAVYVARYFIHETLVVTFSLALVVAVIYYLDRRLLRYLLAAAAAAALLFTTKESALITVLVLLIAVGVGHLYLQLRSADGPPPTRAGDPHRNRSRSGSTASSTGQRRPVGVQPRRDRHGCRSLVNTWRARSSCSWSSTSSCSRPSSPTSRG
jgi:uncharacterized protein (TIGR03663 family)